MDPRQLKDPAAGVQMQLLPHLHLVSRHKYPMMSTPSLETIVHYLTEAPKVMREMAPVQWQFLDAPPDGSMFLTWQPTDYLNMNFASDGYVWGDAEQAYNSDVRGYTLQMLMHRAGYKPQLENMATHSRRRYRLVPNNQMGMPQPDPNLWLVHYSKAQPRDQHPAASLQMLPHVAQQFSQRQMIQRSGQLPRKEFMFADRTQWPVINLPAGVGRAGSSGQLVGAHRRGQSLTHEATLEEEEDVSRGDALDFMTPRDISRMRYEQHHEWMEEVLESPYATKQIVPSELGLGRKGALESLTTGFFTAPTSTTHDPVQGSVGKLAPGKAEEFTKHANAKLAEMQAELEKMKQEHLRRMEKLRRTTNLGEAERKLRNMNVADDSYKNVAAQVQDMVGRQIEPVSKIKILSKGGLQDIRPIVPEPQQQMQQGQQNNVPVAQQYPQSQHQSQVQLQPPQQPQQNQQPVPQNNMQPQAQAQPQPQPMPAQKQETQPQNLATPNAQVATEAQTGPAADASAKPQPDFEDSNGQTENNDIVHQHDDLDMGDTDDQNITVGDDNGDPGDWDMINEPPADEQGQEAPPDTTNQDVSAPTTHQGTPSGNEPQNQLQTNLSSNNTPGDTGDFDMVTDFDTNMDTAGDALADYGAGDDLLDDSAFGDAFHHNQQDMS